MEVPMPGMYAAYSAQSAAKHGTLVCKTEDGDEVRATVISDKDDFTRHRIHQPDLTIIGKISAWIKKEPPAAS